MAKPQQFHLEVASRVDRDSDPSVGEPFDLDIPPFLKPEFDPQYEDEEDPYPNHEAGDVIVQGREIEFEPPILSQFLMMQVTYESSDNILDMSSSMMVLIMSCMNDDDKRYIRRRFNDRDDPFGFEQMSGIVTIMMETWSTRPTKKASGSSSSPQTSGRASTRKQPARAVTTSEN